MNTVKPIDREWEDALVVQGTVYDLAVSRFIGDAFLRHRLLVRVIERGTRHKAILSWPLDHFQHSGSFDELSGKVIDAVRKFVVLWTIRVGVPDNTELPIVPMDLILHASNPGDPMAISWVKLHNRLRNEETRMMLCKCMNDKCTNIHFGDLTPEKQAAIDAASASVPAFEFSQPERQDEDKEGSWPENLESKG